MVYGQKDEIKEQNKEMKSDCCGAEIIQTHSKEGGIFNTCTACSCLCEDVSIPKLTPEQVKAIRWAEMDARPYKEAFIRLIGEEDKYMMDWLNWAIRYALHDLMEEKEK